jgi:hypothetical protein
MRRRAIHFARTLESPAGTPDAETFAFWPYDLDPAAPGPLLTLKCWRDIRRRTDRRSELELHPT